MAKANEIIIFDTEGKLLWEGEIDSPILGLQGGETFWFGTPEDRKWSKIIRVAYGIDTQRRKCIIELVVESSSSKCTRTSENKDKVIDYGEHKISGNDGGSWSINNGDIVATIGSTIDTPQWGSVSHHVDRITLQINTAEEPKIETCTGVINVGTILQATTADRVVTLTLTKVTANNASVRVIEHRR